MHAPIFAISSALITVGCVIGCGPEPQTTSQKGSAEKTNSIASADSISYLGGFMLFGGQQDLCLDVPGNNAFSGAALQAYQCNGTVAQQFTLGPNLAIQLTENTNLCVDVRQGNFAQGTTIQLWTCNGTLSQQWIVWSALQINGFFGPSLQYCLGANGVDNGSGITLQPCDFSTQSQAIWPFGFSVQFVDGGESTHFGNYALDSTADCCNPRLETFARPANDEETFTLTAQHEITWHGTCLDAWDFDSISGHSDLIFDGCSGGVGQSWYVAKGGGSSYYKLQNSFAGNECLNVRDDNWSSNNYVDVNPCDGGDAQQWSWWGIQPGIVH